MNYSTNYSSMVKILAEVYLRYKRDNDWKQFNDFNDIGLPLAFLLDNRFASESESSEGWILATWESLMQALAIEDQASGWLDEDGEEVPAEYLEQKFETLDGVFEYFGTTTPRNVV